MSDNKKILQDVYVEVKEVDDKERTITAIGSKEFVDRDGDIVKIDGINLKNYKKNPVVLLNHNYHDFPIAKAVGRKAWKEDNRLMFKIQFAPDDSNPKSDIAYKLYKGGYMSAFSIGFIPNFEKVEYPEKHPKGARRIFHESELLEISAVSVPANAEALMAGVNKAWDDGVIDGEELNEWEEMVKELDKGEEKEVEFEVVTDPKLIEKTKELAQKLIERDTKIAELKLQLKEQELEEEIDEFDSYLAELFGEFNQGTSHEGEQMDDQTDEEWAEEVLTTLEENDEDE